MNRIWHYQQGETAVGPISEIEIRKLVSSGTLSSEDFVWHKDLSVWMKVNETDLTASIPSPPPPLEKRSDVSAETYETRTISEKLIHGFAWVMILWAAGLSFAVICDALGGNVSGTKFAFWALLVGFFAAKGIGERIWAMPRAKRIRLSTALSVGIPIVILGTAKIINTPK